MEFIQSLDELLNLNICPASGNVVSFDLAALSVDLGPVPIDEIIDFRKENHKLYRHYVRSVRLFMAELSHMDTEERGVAFEDRQAQLAEIASDIQRTSQIAWKKPLSLALGISGAAWRLAHHDPIGAAIAAGGARFVDIGDVEDRLRGQ